MSLPRLQLAELKGFPELDASGKTVTMEFINAANEVIGIIENFGKLFMPIVHDMRGNTNQLLTLYQKDTDKRMYLEDMILTDQQGISNIWLLWLKRALQMVERFFWHILNDNDLVAQKSDSLKPMIVKAYAEVLKPYHGFLLQQTFSVLNRWIPNRKTLLGEDDKFEENIKHIQRLMPKMKLHLDKIGMFLNENGLDSKEKV